MKLYNKPEKKEARKFLRNNSTKAEQLLWDEIKNKKFHGIKFRRQYSVDRYILDFYSIELRLGIELDGEVHDDKDAIEYDKIRTNYLKQRKIKVIRFSNEEIYKSIDNVLNKIKNEIEISRNLPPPAPSL
ncbi:MAG: endonuclease domain-containing protein [Bacteroidetes bacterium]|nr:endonuclease domain-containing protein [Bacteroidota bacterium]